MLKVLITLLLLSLVGCGGNLNTPAFTQPGQAIPRKISTTRPAEFVQDKEATTPAPSDPPPALVDLATRKKGSDWMSFLGPTFNSVSTETGISPWPEAGLKVAWSTKLGEGYAAPVVSKGRLLIFDRVEDKARCRCLKSETGEELWQFTYPTLYTDRFGYDGGPRSCPVTDGELVFLHGADGMFYCLRLVDGKLLWQNDTFKTFNVYPNFFGAGSAPFIHGDLVLHAVGGSPPWKNIDSFMELKGNGSAIVAFNKKTGEVVYKTGDALASYASPVVTSFHGKPTGFYFARDGLFAFDPASGKPLFQHPFRARISESVNAANPVIVKDQIFLTECYSAGCEMLQVSADYKVTSSWTANHRQRDKGVACHWNTPIEVDGYLYGSSGRHESAAELRCISASTGEVMWRETGITRASLLKVDGHFICLGEQGELLLIKINPKKYELVSRWEVTQTGANGKPEQLLYEPCWAGPVLSHGLLYLRGKGMLVCLELLQP